jgi:ABC-type branched-subunit amino acid transport system ATPase component
VLRAVLELRDAGTAVLLVEEHAHNALRLADQLIFLELGVVKWSGAPQETTAEELASAYLGAGS